MYNRVFWEIAAYKYPIYINTEHLSTVNNQTKQDRRLRSSRDSGERGTWRISHVQKDTKVGQSKLGWKCVPRRRKTRDHKHYWKTTNKNIGGSDRSKGGGTGAGAQVRKSRRQPSGQWCHHVLKWRWGCNTLYSLHWEICVYTFLESSLGPVETSSLI